MIVLRCPVGCVQRPAAMNGKTSSPSFSVTLTRTRLTDICLARAAAAKPRCPKTSVDLCAPCRTSLANDIKNPSPTTRDARRQVARRGICANFGSRTGCRRDCDQSCNRATVTTPKQELPTLVRPARPTPARRGIPVRSDVEEILQNEMSVLGCDAFGMELHAVHR